ncbi:hypothetical protein FBU59_006943, partial [Linderina macrospora]
MPEVCAPAFVYITDGVTKSNFSVSKIQEVTSSLSRRNTQCTIVQVGSQGGFTPDATLGFAGDSEMLLFLAASLNGRFIYASDCPSVVVPKRANFYHEIMLVGEFRLSRSSARHRYDMTQCGARRISDMPRERLINNDSVRQTSRGADSDFPWTYDSRPPIVDTVTVRYADYNLP